MKLWQHVKLLEANKKKLSTKLPLHDRDRYYVYRLPIGCRENNIVHSLSGAIERLVWRFRRVFGIRVDFHQKVFGYGTSNHHMRLTIKIYYKQKNNHGGIR